MFTCPTEDWVRATTRLGTKATEERRSEKIRKRSYQTDRSPNRIEVLTWRPNRKSCCSAHRDTEGRDGRCREAHGEYSFGKFGLFRQEVWYRRGLQEMDSSFPVAVLSRYKDVIAAEPEVLMGVKGLLSMSSH